MAALDTEHHRQSFTRESPARVAVVGGGPVGFTVALALARHGVPVTVYEADAGFCEGSRAICISRRSLQILARLGAADDFVAKGLHWREGRSYLGTAEVFHLQLDHSPHDRFPPFINLQQNYAERFLAEACLASGLVDIQWSTRAVGVTQDADAVTLDLQSPAGARRETVDWLVAADGGRSTVRDCLGLALEGQTYEHRYLIADIELEAEWPTERKVWFDPPSNPQSTIIMHKQPDDVWRLDYQLHPEEDEEQALDETLIRERISAHLALVGLQRPWRLLWKTIYKAHALTLPGYVRGRVAFAGDAAHLVPIFGVRGLNSGFDDAINLGWKLALVATGRAERRLLETYSAERRGACLENLAEATKSTWFMSPPTAGFTLVRDAVLEIATVNRAFRCLVNPRQASSHIYKDGAIVAEGSHPLLGAPLPEAHFEDGDSIHAHTGSGFSALHFGKGAQDEERDLQLLGIPLRLLSLQSGAAVSDRLAASTGDLFLVRPDGHVAAVLAGVETGAVERELERLLAQVAAVPAKQKGHHGG